MDNNNFSELCRFYGSYVSPSWRAFLSVFEGPSLAPLNVLNSLSCFYVKEDGILVFDIVGNLYCIEMYRRDTRQVLKVFSKDLK